MSHFNKEQWEICKRLQDITTKDAQGDNVTGWTVEKPQQRTTLRVLGYFKKSNMTVSKLKTKEIMKRVLNFRPHLGQTNNN